MTKNKFLFLILAGALVFATLGCKQVTNSGSGEQGGGDKPSVEPTPEPVPDTWTEITSIENFKGINGTFKGSGKMTGWDFAGTSDKTENKENLEAIEVPFNLTVIYPNSKSKVEYTFVYELDKFVAAMVAATPEATEEQVWGTIKGDPPAPEYSEGKPYTRTESMSATEEKFLTEITGEARTMSVRVNQDKTKLEVNMLEPLVVTVILNKQ